MFGFLIFYTWNDVNNWWPKHSIKSLNQDDFELIEEILIKDRYKPFGLFEISVGFLLAIKHVILRLSKTLDT